MGAVANIRRDRIVTIETEEIQRCGKNIDVGLHTLSPHNQDAFPHTFQYLWRWNRIQMQACVSINE